MHVARRSLILAPVTACLRGQPTTPILLIVADGHGYHLGALGTPGLRTPRLDLLADEGAFFTHAYAAPLAMRADAMLTASQPGQTYTAALELFRKKPAVTIVTLDRSSSFANARPTVLAGEVRLPPWLPDLTQARAEFSRYLGFIQGMDVLAGAVLDALSRAGLDEETLVIYTSNGGHIGGYTAGYLDTRRPLLDFALHVPLLVRGPGVVPHSVRHDLVSIADLPKPATRDYVAAEGARGRTVFDGRFRYVRNREPGQAPPPNGVWEEAKSRFPLHWRWLTAPIPAEELYDHAADPDELHNLSADAAYREQLARLAQLAGR